MKNRTWIVMSLTLGLLLGIVTWQHQPLVSASPKFEEPIPNLHGEPAIDYLKRGGLFETLRSAVEADSYGNESMTKATRAGANALQSGNLLGASVAISGLTVVVGAPGEDSNRGAAYIYGRGSGTWVVVKRLTPSDGQAGDSFGYRVAISGDTAIVGAFGHNGRQGAAYLFERNRGGPGNWAESKKLTAPDTNDPIDFGSSVAISGDRAIVGAPGADAQKGSAYIFARHPVLEWDFRAKLTASDGHPAEFFGGSVSISGTMVIVGAFAADGTGAAYIFEESSPSSWPLVNKLTASDGAIGDYFGISVAISGNTAIVGAARDDNLGSAYIFARAGLGPFVESKKVTASDGFAGDQFGISVAIRGDTAVVGAYGDDEFKGSAYIFERDRGAANNWGELTKLIDPTGAVGDELGASVAIGFRVLVGAPLKNPNGAFFSYSYLVDAVGIFRSGFFWLQDVNGDKEFNEPPDRAFAFGGLPGDFPITGDWNGDGRSKVGVYRSSNALFLLDYDGDRQFTGADKVYQFTSGGADIPVVGDWNGDGTDKVGLFRQGFFWILDYDGNGTFDGGVQDKTFAFGGVSGDVPVVGDWDGNGKSKIGLFRAGFFWILDQNGDGVLNSVNQPGGDQAFAYGGLPGDVPMVGAWTGGADRVGVFRAGFFWVLDANGNRQFDGTDPGQDLAFPFGGLMGDKPVVGRW